MEAARLESEVQRLKASRPQVTKLHELNKALTAATENVAAIRRQSYSIAKTIRVVKNVEEHDQNEVRHVASLGRGLVPSGSQLVSTRRPD